MSTNLSIEKLANATIKNRAEYSQLSTDLKRIEKEKRNELKMHNNEKQRFKSKYMKSNFGTGMSDASSVKMYETHNPGFCFRRNGEHRVPQALNISPPIDFEHLQFLLFTNGEVDIEKVLCLHLLSSHETKHLTQPKSSNFTAKDSPLEQLIERSKDYQIEANSSTILPTYVLDINKENIEPNQKEDERLSSRLIINEKLLELITTVITALEQSNPEKVQDLISIADDPSNLKRIFRKPHLQEFVMLLREHSIVNSCSSFILTQPSKIQPNHLEIRTASGALEDLVRFIRSNVLQFPKRNNWKMIEEDSKDTIKFENTPPPVFKNIDTRKIRSPRIRREEEVEEEINNFRRTSKNFIAKNIDAIANYKRIDDDLVPLKRHKRDSTVLKKTEESTIKKIIKSSIKQGTRERSNEIKVHLKQTTCPACMEKWKVPLPSPKVPTVGRGSTIESLDGSLFKTNKIQRLSILIEREQFKLDTYDRRYSNLSNVSNLSQSKRKKSSQSSTIDNVELNVRDLEKIRQAVREKETKKKLEKFLKA